jgi:hypothetical protein
MDYGTYIQGTSTLPRQDIKTSSSVGLASPGYINTVSAHGDGVYCVARCGTRYSNLDDPLRHDTYYIIRDLSVLAHS